MNLSTDTSIWQLFLGILTLACPLVCATTVVTDAHAETVKTASGLEYSDEKVGEGAEAKAGADVEVHYTGWLDQDGKKGNKFDSSVDRGKPFRFNLGKGMVIAGWDEGVAGMKVGGKRTLMIPAKLGYGERGYPPVIPGNSKLIFDVELVSVK